MEASGFGVFVVAEVDFEGARYALSAGVWFAIDKDFVNEVQERIDAIEDLTDVLALDSWNLGLHKAEGGYNNQLAGTRNWALLDAKNFYAGGPNQKIEICDVLTPDKMLLCVKRMSRSSTLSHLFMQGMVSAQLMVSNAKGYRDRLMADLATLAPSSTFGNNQDWTVVFAIATDKPGPLSKSLYFFSKVALDRIATHLRSTGVKGRCGFHPVEAVRARRLFPSSWRRGL